VSRVVLTLAVNYKHTQRVVEPRPIGMHVSLFEVSLNVDFMETFAPTASLAAFRLLVSIFVLMAGHCAILTFFCTTTSLSLPRLFPTVLDHLQSSEISLARLFSIVNQIAEPYHSLFIYEPSEWTFENSAESIHDSDIAVSPKIGGIASCIPIRVQESQATIEYQGSQSTLLLAMKSSIYFLSLSFY